MNPCLPFGNTDILVGMCIVNGYDQRKIWKRADGTLWVSLADGSHPVELYDPQSFSSFDEIKSTYEHLGMSIYINDYKAPKGTTMVAGMG